MPSDRVVLDLPTISDVPAISATEENCDESGLELGAWARYPSHTRTGRTGSAQGDDDVNARNFAHEAKMSALLTESSSDDDLQSSKQNKQKEKRNVRFGIPKSRSMTFAKDVLKRYARYVWATNAEFLKRRHVHHPDISARGKLIHPELEMLPPVFATTSIAEEPDPSCQVPNSFSTDEARDSIELQVLTPMHSTTAQPASVTLQKLPAIPPDLDGAWAEDDFVTIPTGLSKATRSVSSPSLAITPEPDRNDNCQSAQFWSRVYESCVELPRFSDSGDNSGQVSLPEPRFSFDSRTMSTTQDVPLLVGEMLSAIPNRALLRAGSPNSRQSLPAYLRGHGKRESIVSVGSIRASSMDLLKLLKATEERERVRLMEIMDA
jgi:hypothetical protein